MAIDEESLRWASVDEIDPTTGLPNKSDPSSELKNTGLKKEEGLARQWLNHQFNAQYNALVDLQTQIDAITGGSSQPTLDIIFHVGCVYTSYDSTDPTTRFGFGVWEQIEDVFPVAIGSDPAYNTAGQTGGAKTHTHINDLSVDGHILTESEIPTHTHDVEINETLKGSGNGSSNSLGLPPVSGDSSTYTTDSYGGSSAHTHGLSGGVQSNSNLPPYYGLYYWRRLS